MTTTPDAPSHHRPLAPRARMLSSFIALLALSFAMSAQESKPADPAHGLQKLVRRLPADWGPVVVKYQALLSPDATRLSKASDDRLKGEVLLALSNVPDAEDFVLDHAFTSSVAGKQMTGLLYSFWKNGHWANNSRLPSVLLQAASTETDPKTSALIVETLHTVAAIRVRNLNREREEKLSRMEDKAHQEEVAKLQAEDQDLSYAVEGINLPDFLRTAPPVFTVKTSRSSIRVVTMGDFGTDGRDEHLVATAMLNYGQAHPYDFGITVGDNFYFPMTSAEDPHWDSVWEKLYGPLHVTFYPAFGNHDWGGDMPAAELTYTYRSGSWHFPAPYYTYIAGPAQFFAINPEFGNDGYTHVPDAQVSWLKTELEKSTAVWKVVYGHFPLYQSTWNDDGLIKTLMPVLKGRADLYLSGHVHNLQQHKPVDGVNFFVIGASGRGGTGVNTADPGTIWAKTAYGFGVLEADNHAFTVRIIGEDGAELHAATLLK